MWQVEVLTWPQNWSGWELQAHFESASVSPEVTNRVMTSVSALALALPGIFMSNSDAARMVQMLSETRDKLNGVVVDESVATGTRKPVVANDNKKSVKLAA